MDDTLHSIDSVPTAELRSMAKEFDRVYTFVMKHDGVTATLAELEAALEATTPPTHFGQHSFLLLPKFLLLKYFKHYERALPSFAQLPPHARIGIDLFNIRDSATKVEVYQLEAALHEDVAALWNAAVAAQREADATEAPVITKPANALRRAAPRQRRLSIYSKAT